MKSGIFSIYILLISIGCCSVNAQNNANPVNAPGFKISKRAYPKKDGDPGKIHNQVDEMPCFNGGTDSFNAYVQKELKYPEKAKEASIAGKVYVYFIVEPDGRISSGKVLRGIPLGCNEEALRLIQNSPRWIPGKLNGKPVRVEKILPIDFTIH